MNCPVMVKPYVQRGSPFNYVRLGQTSEVSVTKFTQIDPSLLI